MDLRHSDHAAVLGFMQEHAEVRLQQRSHDLQATP